MATASSFDQFDLSFKTGSFYILKWHTHVDNYKAQRKNTNQTPDDSKRKSGKMNIISHLMSSPINTIVCNMGFYEGT